RQYLGRSGEVSKEKLSEASNCFGAAISFYTDEKVSYKTDADLSKLTAKLLKVPADEAPHFGEILYFSEGVEHAAIYLFDGLIFQKPTVGVYHRYEIVPYEKMFNTFNGTIFQASKM